MDGTASTILINHMRVSVTYYCNLHCEHCYVPVELRDGYKRLLEPSQVSIQQITTFLDYLHRAHGLSKLSVTGGEPLLKKVYSRTSSLLEFANNTGLEVQLNTGGLGQIEIAHIVSHFDDPSKLLFQFSFDGATPDTVDTFRRRPGVYDSALRQMSQAVALGARVQARMTANRNNVSESLEAYRLMASVPVSSFKIKPMFAAGVAIDNADAFLTDTNEIRELQTKLIFESRNHSTTLDLAPPIFVDTSSFNSENVRFHGCDCGVNSGYLSTNGDIYPCSYIFGDRTDKEFVVGNILDPGFDFVSEWTNSLALRSYKNNRGCLTCPSQVSLMQNITRDSLACS